jgi:hydroxylamine dehydrogenase
MRFLILLLSSCLMIAPLFPAPIQGAEEAISPATQECLDCHITYHSNIVVNWLKSRHATVTPKAAMNKNNEERRISSTQIPDALMNTVVGCAECHAMRPESHRDTFQHNGYRIHLVPSPDDCATCHAVERVQFSENIMAMAEKNLSENSLYQDMEQKILGVPQVENHGLSFSKADAATRADGCYYCHGARLKVTGMESRETDVGVLEFPVIEGWPNQGVGRLNPDGSRGTCSACHTRHLFSIETARKPYTCKECHSGPDVPAFKVYSASKHGNLFDSHGHQWDFSQVPWRIGKDFTAPTCATCHISQSVNSDGRVIAQRTHRMNDRLSIRLFGLFYAHPHPKSPDTTIIRNKSGLPLPTDMDGSVAHDYLISEEQVTSRNRTMQAICLACHGTQWVKGHFERLNHVISTSNASVLTSMGMMQTIWRKGLAQGLEKGGSIFDEATERRWSDIWLIYANNIRFSAAMAGGGDYGIFEDGRYLLGKALMDLQEKISLQQDVDGFKRSGTAPHE